MEKTNKYKEENSQTKDAVLELAQILGNTTQWRQRKGVPKTQFNEQKQRFPTARVIRLERFAAGGQKLHFADTTARYLIIL